MPKVTPPPSPMPDEVRYGDTPCKRVPPDVMFPAERGDPEAVDRALRVCRACPFEVKAKCLKWALDNHEVEGVYGETLLKHRRAIVNPPPPRAKPVRARELALAA